MKKLFRPLIILACLGIISTAAIAALSPVLESKVEDLVRASLAANGCTAASVKFTSPDNLVITDFGAGKETDAVNGRVAIGEIAIRIPAAFLASLVQPDSILPESGMVGVASSVELKNFAQTFTANDQGRQSTRSTTTRQARLENVRLDASILRNLLAGSADHDAISIFYGMEMDSMESHDSTSTDPGDGVVATSARVVVREVKRGSYASVGIDDLRVNAGSGQIARLESIAMRGLEIPEADLRAMMGQDVDTDEFFMKMFADSSPWVQEVRLGRIDLNQDGDKATIDSLVFTASDNWKRNLVINGLVMPTVQLSSDEGWAAFFAGMPELRLDCSYAQAMEGNGRKGQIILKGDGLGSIALDLTVMGDLEKLVLNAVDNPMILLGTKFRDLRLAIDDKGLLARSLVANGHTAETAPQEIEALISETCSTPTDENRKLGEALRTFATMPGFLEIYTSPGNELLVASLIAVAQNAGAVFSAKARPGKQKLVNQMRALPVVKKPAEGKQEQNSSPGK